MFTFRLQSVLDVRHALEEKALVAFSDERRRLAREEEILTAMLQKRESHVNQLREAANQPLRVSHVAVLISYLEILRQRIDAQKHVISEANRSLEVKRAELIAAAKKKKIMETLRENQLAEHRWETLTRERKELDELAVLRFAGGDT
jgi:flagellar protein FliJ